MNVINERDERLLYAGSMAVTVRHGAAIYVLAVCNFCEKLGDADGRSKAVDARARASSGIFACRLGRKSGITRPGRREKRRKKVISSSGRCMSAR